MNNAMYSNLFNAYEKANSTANQRTLSMC